MKKQRATPTPVQRSFPSLTSLFATSAKIICLSCEFSALSERGAYGLTIWPFGTSRRTTCPGMHSVVASGKIQTVPMLFATAGDPRQARSYLGQYMITATPARQMAPPSRSRRSGAMRSTPHPHRMESTTKIPP